MTTAQPKQPSRKNTFSPEESRWTHVKNHLRDDVSSSLLAEMQLVILTFCTGIQGEDFRSRDLLDTRLSYC